MIMIVGMVMAVAMAWAAKNYLPSIMEAKQQCIAPRVMDDMSKELLTCYENIDRCNKYSEACVNIYLNKQPEGTAP